MPPVMEAPLAMDCYEDMFKEITRKLYGEDDNMNSNPRSITAEYDHTTGGFKSEDGGALAAFGLAALMQNGFPPPPPPPHAHPQDRWVCSEENLPWTTSKVASYNPVQRVFRCAECDSVGSLARVAEHWLGAHANLRVFQCPQCPYSSAWARCVRMHLSRQHNVSEDSLGPLHKESPALQEVSKFLHRLRARAESGPPPPPAPSAPPPPPPPPPPTAPKQENSGGVKRYCCGFCPYATDRRDLFTRHENIHRAEKPFQCYVCQKQFNRADHVKKHFLRMHRDYPYDLNRIRRQPPKNASGMSYYHKYNNNTTSSSSGTNNSNNGNSNNGGRPQDNHHMLSMPHPPPIHQGHLHPGLNIPGGFPPMGIRSGSNGVGKQKSSHGGCNAKSHGGKMKKKGEKRYSCCYCAWSGVDNWCLKRHLNTHLKPFVCVLCDYKAARSERLATHVLKVHNKRSCGRCSFLADDQAQLTIHLQEHHPLEHRNNRSSNNVLRNVGFSNHPPPGPTPFGYQTSDMVKREHMDTNLGGPLYGAEGVHCPRRQHWGAARLFHYMEASDASDEGEEMEQEEVELPEFVCRECGCEFVDDASLETHNMTHHRVSSSAEERAATTCNSSSNHCAYQCSVCGHGMGSQTAMMDHMKSHSSICNEARAGQETHRDTNLLRCPHCSIALVTYEDIRQHREQHHNLETCVNCDNMARKHYADSIMDSNMNHQKVGDQNINDSVSASKRSRKQSQPRKVVPDILDCMEIRVHRSRLARGRSESAVFSTLAEKYSEMLLTRRCLKCAWCRQEFLTFPYHTPASLAFHHLWRHARPKFPCEHCEASFRHRYQVVLHSSREHVRPITTVPESNEEPIILSNTPVPAQIEPSLSKVNVPDLLLHTDKPIHTPPLKVPSLLDPSLLHESNRTLLTPLPPSLSSSSPT